MVDHFLAKTIETHLLKSGIDFSELIATHSFDGKTVFIYYKREFTSKLFPGQKFTYYGGWNYGHAHPFEELMEYFRDNLLNHIYIFENFNDSKDHMLDWIELQILSRFRLRIEDNELAGCSSRFKAMELVEDHDSLYDFLNGFDNLIYPAEELYMSYGA